MHEARSQSNGGDLKTFDLCIAVYGVEVVVAPAAVNMVTHHQMAVVVLVTHRQMAAVLLTHLWMTEMFWSSTGKWQQYSGHQLQIVVMFWSSTGTWQYCAGHPPLDGSSFLVTHHQLTVVFWSPTPRWQQCSDDPPLDSSNSSGYPLHINSLLPSIDRLVHDTQPRDYSRTHCRAQRNVRFKYHLITIYQSGEGI